MKKTIRMLFLLICFTLVAVGTGGYTYAAPNQPIKVIVNGQFLDSYQQAVFKDGRVLVPMRAISESLGATLIFQSATKPIVIKNGSSEISFTLGNKTAYVNGKKISLDVPPQTINNVSMVPLRFIADSFNTDIEWKEVWKIASIESKHAASDVMLTQDDASKKAKSILDSSVFRLDYKGIAFLRYYSFIANTKEYSYDFYHYVDKYTGEIYSVDVEGTFENLSRAKAIEILEEKVRPLLKREPNISDMDSGEVKIINNQKHYVLDVFFVGASNPYYFATTVFVTLDGKVPFMLDKNNKVIPFSDDLFMKYVDAALSD